MNTGEYIKWLRMNKGISQEELGKIIGVQRAAVQKWESGAVTNLKRTAIQKLANYFKVNPANFIVENDLETIYLSPIEEQLIIKYRENPQMQEAVNKLLGL